MFKGIFHQFCERRYALAIRLVAKNDKTDDIINDDFQEKYYSVRPSVYWKRINPDTSDFRVKYEFFMTLVKKCRETARKVSRLKVVRCPKKPLLRRDLLSRPNRPLLSDEIF